MRNETNLIPDLGCIIPESCRKSAQAERRRIVARLEALTVHEAHLWEPRAATLGRTEYFMVLDTGIWLGYAEAIRAIEKMEEP